MRCSSATTRMPSRGRMTLFPHLSFAAGRKAPRAIAVKATRRTIRLRQRHRRGPMPRIRPRRDRTLADRQEIGVRAARGPANLDRRPGEIGRIRDVDRRAVQRRPVAEARGEEFPGGGLLTAYRVFRTRMWVAHTKPPEMLDRGGGFALMVRTADWDRRATFSRRTGFSVPDNPWAGVARRLFPARRRGAGRLWAYRVLRTKILAARTMLSATLKRAGGVVFMV